MPYSDPVISYSSKIDEISLKDVIKSDDKITYVKGYGFNLFNKDISFVLDKPRKLVKSIHYNQYYMELFREDMVQFEQLSHLLSNKIDKKIRLRDILNSNNITSSEFDNFKIEIIINPYGTRDLIINPLFDGPFIIGRPVFILDTEHVYDCWYGDKVFLNLKLDSFYR